MNINNNLFKRIFATTAVFTTIASVGVTATVHADDSSTNPGVTTDQMKQYGIEQGYLNPDGTTNYNKVTPVKKVQKSTIDAKTRRLGYTSRVLGTYNNKPVTQIIQHGNEIGEIGTLYELNSISTPIYSRTSVKTYYKNFIMGVSTDGFFGASIQNQKLSNKTSDLKNLLYLSQLEWSLRNNTNNPLNYKNKNHVTFINANKFYKLWLHINIAKSFSYKSLNKAPSIMETGYSTTWLQNKLIWIYKNQDKAFTEMTKAYKQSILKDQRQSSNKNDFDNTTTK